MSISRKHDDKQPIVRLVGIAGSLRENSVNRALLQAVSDLAPADVAVDILDISEIPLYNQDLDNDRERPASVEQLKSAIDAADGVLIATPEYNFGISGVLKNVIDWASRPAMRSPLRGKPVGIMGASPGALGTARAQEQLKTIILSTMANLFPHPGVVIGKSNEKFVDGELLDEVTAKFLTEYIAQFADYVRDFAQLSLAA